MENKWLELYFEVLEYVTKKYCVLIIYQKHN